MPPSAIRQHVLPIYKEQAAIAHAHGKPFILHSCGNLSEIMEGGVGPVLEARHALSHLRRWMKPRRRSTELLFMTNRAWIEYQPKGVVGVIGTGSSAIQSIPIIARQAASLTVFQRTPKSSFGVWP